MIAEVVGLSGKWIGLTALLVVVLSVVHLLSRDPRKLRHGILEGMCLPRFLSALDSADLPTIDRTSRVFVCVCVFWQSLRMEKYHILYFDPLSPVLCVLS